MSFLVGNCKKYAVIIVVIVFLYVFYKYTHRAEYRYTEESDNGWRNDRASHRGDARQIPGKTFCHHSYGTSLTRHTRDTSFVTTNKKKFGKAVYFSGKEKLKLKRRGKYSRVEVPNGSFTVSLWVKPEGGQGDPVTIVGVFDVCSGKAPTSGWSIGISGYKQGSHPNPRFHFVMQSDRTSFKTTMYDINKYIPNVWKLVSVTYDENSIKMFIDRSHISTSLEQQGKLFGKISRKCKEIRLGGGMDRLLGFRGNVDELRIFNVPLSQEHVSNIFLSSAYTYHNISLYENFDNLKGWRKASTQLATLVKSDISTTSLINLVKVPPCGMTVCDDPLLVKSYLNNSQLRSPKQLRYRVINVHEEDGTNPQVSSKQMAVQHVTLQNAFSKYNISWSLESSTSDDVYDSKLRRKLILIACDPWDVGDGICNKECVHPRTGFDGGDCEPYILPCNIRDLNNSICNPECNKEYHLWDLGDCCKNDTNSGMTCFDPKSEYRQYLGINDFKQHIGLNGSSHMNVFLASRAAADFVGLSTMPWDKNVYGILGGVVVQEESFGIPGRSKGLVHEVGHVLGLWHVHRGVSELECNDPCFETEPSMKLGDLCSDTNPTPSNKLCRDPADISSVCGLTSFHATPFTNYMSYAGDACTNHFTPQQVARMHCYIDLMYKSWSIADDPVPIPLAPRVISSDNTSISIIWIPPLNQERRTMSTHVCDLCSDTGILTQFATSSTSSHPGGYFNMWTPQQAQGPPDAESCELSDRAWIPDTDHLTCLSMNCYIELTFAIPVVPVSLRIWVVYTDEGEIGEIQLIHINDDRTYLPGPFPAFCDTELTVQIDVRKAVSKVRIYVNHPHVAIDAVELSTSKDYKDCRSCKLQRYKLSREPAFPHGKATLTTVPWFLDRNVQHGVNYTYFVTVLSKSKESVQSPVLIHGIGLPHCGDGRVDSLQEEECDDGNVVDGDGCSINCRTEKLFRCSGSPSLCYRHDGDGVCEDFERAAGLSDCGYLTPPGYEDQWVEYAVANPLYQRIDCPESLLVGKPASTKRICHPNFSPTDAWHPCGHLMEKANFWIEVFFAKMVVATEIIVHLRSDGSVDFEQSTQSVQLQLITSDNKTVAVGSRPTLISCRHNPVHVHVTQDLTQPFFLSKGVRIMFTAFNLSISGVRMRSSKFLNMVNIASCTDTEMFNPKSGRCVPKNCSLPSCDNLYIRNGRTLCSGFREGDLCNVSCNTGYKLTHGLNEFVCVNGTWKNPSPVSCSPVDCERPEVPHAVVSCPNGTTLHKTCTFKCHPQASLQGMGTSLTCQSDGHWSLRTSYCQVQCPSPPLRLGNSKLTTKKCRGHGYHDVGSRCKFKCLKGYHVRTEKPFNRYMRMTCEDDGEWHGDICIRIRCPPIEPVFTGLYSCTNLNYVGSKCTLKCPGGQGAQAIKCTSKGKWSNDFEMCSSGIQGSCPMLPSSNDVVFNCLDNYIGYQCDVICTLPNSKPIVAGRTNKVRGRLNGQMATFGKVRKLTCTALSEWQPDPATLVCVESCKVEYMSDGWCDAENNRAQCDWDGGDCCHSTSPEGIAIPFPDTCKQECSCLDPNAEENRTSKKKQKKKQRRKNKSKTLKKKQRKSKKNVFNKLSTRSVSYNENQTNIFYNRWL